MSQIFEVENNNKLIFFIDEDVPLLRKFGQILADTYRDYQVKAMTDLKGVKQALKEEKPQVIISCLNFNDGSDIISFYQELKSSEITRDISLITTGTRAELEPRMDELIELSSALLPKAITTPQLQQVVKEAIKKANSIGADTITLEAGDHLFHEGDQSDAIYILKSGELQVYKRVNGQNKELSTINQQQMIGEMALIDKALRSASIRATIPSQVLKLHLGDVEKYINEQPFWMRMLIHTLTTRVRESNQKLLEK
jgi:DNA-binding response OmpR family regulator